MEPMTLDLTAAFRIAVEVHGAQRDLQGQPYLFHVFRVAAAMETDEERVVAILHDALEDAADPDEIGFRIYEAYGNRIREAIDALTRETGEPYLESYIHHIAQNPLAVKIKFADIQDNRNPERLRKLPRVLCDRLYDKYEKAWLTLYAAADQAGTLPAPPVFLRRAPYPGVLPRCDAPDGEDWCVLPLGHPGNHMGGPGREWVPIASTSPHPDPTAQS